MDGCIVWVDGWMDGISDEKKGKKAWLIECEGQGEKAARGTSDEGTSNEGTSGEEKEKKAWLNVKYESLSLVM